MQTTIYRTTKIKKKLLFTALLLSFLTFTSCGDKKTEADDKETNPFGIDSNIKPQILQPCRWSFTVEQRADGEAILISTAKLDSGWHLYSQHISDKNIRTEFTYDSLHTYKLIGNTEEGEPIKKYDPYLEMEVLYFEREAVFRQKIKALSKNDFTITGTIDYTACLTQCVFPDEDFYFNVKGNPQGE